MDEKQFIRFAFIELANDADAMKRKINHLKDRLDELTLNAVHPPDRAELGDACPTCNGKRRIDIGDGCYSWCPDCNEDGQA